MESRCFMPKNKQKDDSMRPGHAPGQRPDWTSRKNMIGKYGRENIATYTESHMCQNMCTVSRICKMMFRLYANWF